MLTAASAAVEPTFPSEFTAGNLRVTIGTLGDTASMSNRPAPSAGLDVADAAPDRPVRRGAKALVSTSSRVLLVRERHADGRTFWTLPGGGVQPRESPADAVRRELDEELGCGAVVNEPVSTFWYAHLSTSSAVTVYSVFDCSVTSRVRPARSEGVLDARWVDPARPPARTLLQVRHLLREHGRRSVGTRGPSSDRPTSTR